MTAIGEGLAKLGKRHMLLAIHDVSFPSDADEDLGRGAPTTRAAARLVRYAHDLGFTGLQLGPQGQPSRDNASPYDATVFSRNIANVAVASLEPGGPFEGLVAESEIERRLAPGGHARNRHAYDASHALLDAAWQALERGARPDLRAALDAFRSEHGLGHFRAAAQAGTAPATWLESDALYAALCAQHGGRSFRDWPARDRDLWLDGDRQHRMELLTKHARAIDRYAFGQFLASAEHARFRAACPLLLYGDLQVGYSDADTWRHAGAFLSGYLMGAPPSRTNPEGQPWEYPVLDPAQYDGAAGALVAARVRKAFSEYDAVRVDHPHGFVCPWVYRANTNDRHRAVREGARLFSSPDLPDHPELARYAIARPEQLDRSVPRYHDRWVTDLDDEQVARYAILVDALVDAARAQSRNPEDLSFEVLSTMPIALGRVLARHNLGRWRVTQKADLDDPDDVYRPETASRKDWLMLGNHDTPPIFAVIRAFTPLQRERWARHLTARLRLAEPARLESPGFFATAMLAELLASPAENVSVFFADLFGYEERFNTPGVVDERNWTLRLPADFEALHASRLKQGHALDLPLAVELALAARAHCFTSPA